MPDLMNVELICQSEVLITWYLLISQGPSTRRWWLDLFCLKINCHLLLLTCQTTQKYKQPVKCLVQGHNKELAGLFSHQGFLSVIPKNFQQWLKKLKIF